MTLHMMFDGEWVALPLMEHTSVQRVWHYTDTGGLLGITGSNALWASSPLGLNDASEVSHGLEVFRKVLDEMTQVTADQKAFCDALFGEKLQSLVTDSVFFLCASRDGDLLNQWQHYSRAQGYSIGLKTGIMLFPQSHIPTMSMIWTGWFDVIYEPQEQVDMAREVLTFILKHLAGREEDGSWATLSHAWGMIGNVASRFKHVAFKPEAEVRYIYARVEGIKELFRPGPRGVVPYIELAAPIALPGPNVGGNDPLRVAKAVDLLPITDVRCGPTDSKDRSVTEQAVDRMLKNRGYGSVSVDTSEIPYRFG